MATPAVTIPGRPVTGPLIDVGMVVGACALAFLVEEQANARGMIPYGEVVRGASGVVVGALTALVVVRIRGGSFADLGLTRPRRVSLVPLWVVGLLGAFVAGQLLAPALISPLLPLPEPDLSRYDSIAGSLPAAVVLALLLPFTASIPEEIIYRGFLIGRFEQLFGSGAGSTALAVVLQALIFGAVHFQWGLGGMIVTVIMGLIWGVGFLLCGRNLWIVILAHTVGHVLGVVQMYLQTSIVI